MTRPPGARGAAEFTIGEVASMIGFSPHTIRAWERRHNILKPLRTASGQRRYSADDVELLREVVNSVVMRGLTLKVAVQAAQGRLAVHALDGPTGPRRAPGAERAEPESSGVPWRAVADLLSQLVAVLDEEGRVVDANVALAAAAGCTREQLRGGRFADFADPYDRAKAVTAFRPPFQRRLAWELNLRLGARHGLFAFDCLPVRCEGRQLLIVMGQEKAWTG